MEILKSEKNQKVLTKKMSAIKWKPLLKDLAIITAKGVIAGFSYQIGVKIYDNTFLTITKNDSLKILEGGKSISKVG